MSNPFYQVIGKASNAINSLALCPATNAVIVEYSNGNKYLYSGVSSVAVQGALFKLDSLGEFVNKFCKSDSVDYLQLA